MAVRLVLYWFIMALLLVAAILSILMATGVLSHPARQLAGALDIQQRNIYAALDAQMDDLTAHGVALSEKLGRELDAFLAAKGIPFDALNDDPGTIAELEKRLYAPLSSTLSATSCSGIFFCLNVTANTSLPDADALRAGLYLRYSGLQPTVASEQDVICFRGAAEASRGLQLQMHNRWNPELNVQAVPGYTQLLRGSDGRLAERCLWMGRIALPDTWESVTLLCVPMLDSAYGSMVTVLAPIDGDRLLLGQAMIGSPGGSYLTADGTLTCKTGRYYNTYSDGSRTYLGLHEPIGATDAAGRKLAAVVLVPEIGLRTLEARSRMVWIAGSLVFLAARAYISVATAKKHNTNINRKLGVTSREELMLYIDLFHRCGRLDEIAAPRAEDTARCTT